MKERIQQATLSFHLRGGRRPGAGRKPTGDRPRVSHARREFHDRHHPVHVTLRAARGLSSLRAANLFPVLRGGLAAASTSAFRVVHFSVQSNHVHLLVEAEGTIALSRGTQGLAIRLAKAVNRLIGRRGPVWGDRFHAHALRTPSEVRNGLAYVLLNARKHGAIGAGLDPCSSAAWFTGWTEPVGRPSIPNPLAGARTWLLAIGWRRSGQLSNTAAPGGGGFGMRLPVPRRPPRPRRRSLLSQLASEEAADLGPL